MNGRPHSNSKYKSRLVTNGERHRRRSQLIVRQRGARHTERLVIFADRLLKVFVVCVVIAMFVFIITR